MMIQEDLSETDSTIRSNVKGVYFAYDVIITNVAVLALYILLLINSAGRGGAWNITSRYDFKSPKPGLNLSGS